MQQALPARRELNLTAFINKLTEEDPDKKKRLKKIGNLNSPVAYRMKWIVCLSDVFEKQKTMTTTTTVDPESRPPFSIDTQLRPYATLRVSLATGLKKEGQVGQALPKRSKRDNNLAL